MFPERWIDLVVVLRCDHSLLWKRLEKRLALSSLFLTGLILDSIHRGYTEAKIEENNSAEIMQVVLEDAKESYAEEIVVELSSENTEQVEENVTRIVGWIQAWISNLD